MERKKKKESCGGMRETEKDRVKEILNVLLKNERGRERKKEIESKREGEREISRSVWKSGKERGRVRRQSSSIKIVNEPV